ncbi:hypothetical protein ACOSP7_000373 [Xanthoceras sorbifolium]
MGLSGLPWIIGGDFNEILRSEEKLGGLVRSHRAMDSFREVVDDCNLIDMGFKGSLFTWSNRQDVIEKAWNSRVGQDAISVLQSNLKDQLADLQNGVGNRDWGKIRALEDQIDAVVDKFEVFWRQRSRATWLKAGDKNSKFFHAKASQRRRRNKINGILDSDGVWKEKEADIARVVSDYYNKLFDSTFSSCFLTDSVLQAV